MSAPSTHILCVTRGDIDDIEVECEMDGGQFHAATHNGLDFVLTRAEIESVEVDYSDAMVDREQAAREDAADRKRDR